MKLKKTIILSLLCLFITDATAVLISPNSNQLQGTLPIGHENLTFQLRDGDWVPNLFLPWYGQDGDTVIIKSSAAYASQISNLKTDLPFPLSIKNNQSYQFKFNAKTRLWHLQFEKTLSPNQSPDFNQAALQTVVINDDNWVSSLRLPQGARDGSMLKISSESQKTTRINSEGVLFASTLSLKKDEAHWYRYYQALNKWVAESTTARQFDVKKVGPKMVTVNAALTQVNFSDANWLENLTLPVNAQDRDRIIVTSTAAWPAKINNTNINSNASLTLLKNDRYEFVFIADQEKWIIDSAPMTALVEKKLVQSQLPDVLYPVTKVIVNPSNWQAALQLPNKAQIDDKVILESSALQTIQVSSKNGLKASLRNGETQRYIYTAKGWVADSHTIDLLLVIDPAVVMKIGESAAKLRLLAGLELTNLTAQNSNAQFYMRQAGVVNQAIQGKDLYEVMDNILLTPTVLSERNRVGADMVYYESNEQAKGICGLGFSSINAPKPDSMVALGLNSCGISVMRHELGHNFGLQHYNDDQDTIHRGFNHILGSTAMGGNNLNYYSSPKLYSPKYAVRLGEAGKIDAVSLLNKNAPIISGFRTAKM
ncbi:zinc-dependent metalloprotease family protein [Acinetobacter rudis]|uniref:Metalloprotease StcE beta-sandwich domain-containing protein n=1 Tax=Acinetobacter rudis CIP 110305 TaxID=421052 RepID=S3MS61_9GAMM|nr:zinc-dependent metalloprotease family protein [Acinetobacter rudis]EPF70685.1 hypothetical protein F945_02929 [Acinetobacter rudis CIP 110305]